jgi:hypothetical protein
MPRRINGHIKTKQITNVERTKEGTDKDANSKEQKGGRNKGQ